MIDEDMMQELAEDQRGSWRYDQTVAGRRCDDRTGCGECGNYVQ